MGDGTESEISLKYVNFETLIDISMKRSSRQVERYKRLEFRGMVGTGDVHPEIIGMFVGRKSHGAG